MVTHRGTVDKQNLFVSPINQYRDDPKYPSKGGFHKRRDDDFKGKVWF
jgi:hypothetical protein